jgi:hypothetical protein
MSRFSPVLALLLVGCAQPDGAPLPATLPPLVLPPVAPRDPVIDAVVVATLDADLDPRAGRLQLRVKSARSFDFGSGPVSFMVCPSSSVPCQPPPDNVSLRTDQNRVTFFDFDGTCYSNGSIIDCGTIAAPCNQPGMFCGPIELVSQVGKPMPDPILQLAQASGLANQVLGCRDDDDQTFGTCAGSGKVDAPSSNLTSPIQGSTTLNTVGCSYCYGNPFAANDLGAPGLQHALVTGFSEKLRSINTDVLALQLENANNHNITISVRIAQPALAPPGTQLELFDGVTPVTCARPGITRVVVHGGGFGPPAECLTGDPPSCDVQGTAAAGHVVAFQTEGGGSIPGTALSWSDSAVSAIFPSGARTGRAFVCTPLGNLASLDAVTRCPSFTRGPLLVSGAARMSGGGITATVEVGHGVRRATATGGGVTMQMETAVTP